jgi:DNA-binding MarR family transcriptional regulator
MATPGDRDLATQASELQKAATRILRVARRLDRGDGVGPTQLAVLSILAERGARAVGELAAIENVAAPTMSRLVATIEKAGLVTKTTGTDRRVQTVALTEAGRTIQRDAEARRRRMVEALVSRLKPETVADLLEVLGPLAAGLDRQGSA